MSQPSSLVPAPVDAPPAEQAEAHESGVEGEVLRAVMRHVASPVTVVTAAAGGEVRGATIGSFTSASLAPPLVSFNVTKGSQIHEILMRAERFAVHLLAHDQAHLAEHFARPELSGEAQFAPVPHARARAGAPPVLEGAAAVLHCRRWAVYDAGDHDLLLGRVERVEEREAPEPLLYFARTYRAVGREVGRREGG